MTLKSLLSASFLIAFGMLCGRVLGLLREMTLAMQFGVNSQADLAIALFIVPDFISNALIGSALSATLLPAFAKRNHQAILALFWQAMLVSTVLFLLIALVVAMQEPALMRLLGMEGEAPPHLFAIALLSLPLSAMLAMITAYLQYYSKLLVPAFATVIFNAVIIAALWLAPHSLMGLTLGILAANLVRLLAHAVVFFLHGGAVPRLSKWQMNPAILRSYAATSGSSVLIALVQYAPYAFIAVVGAGVALFNYGFKLLLLPIMIGQTMVQLVMLRWFLHVNTIDISRHERNALHANAIGWITILSIIVAIILWGIAEPLAELCFGHGRMSGADTAALGNMVATNAWILPVMMLGSVLQQLLYAHERLRMNVMVSVLQAALIMPLCWYMMEYGSGGMLAAYGLSQLPCLALLGRELYQQKLLNRPAFLQCL